MTHKSLFVLLALFSLVTNIFLTPVLTSLGGIQLSETMVLFSFSDSLFDMYILGCILNILTITGIIMQSNTTNMFCLLLLVSFIILTLVKAFYYHFSNIYLDISFACACFLGIMPCLLLYLSSVLYSRENNKNASTTDKLLVGDNSLQGEYTLLKGHDEESGLPRNAVHSSQSSIVNLLVWGELMNRLSSDTTTLQSALSVNVSMGLRSGAQIVFSIVFLFITSWKLAIVMVSIMPLLVLAAMLYGKYIRRLSQEYQDALAKAAESGNESISNARVMRSFGAEQLERRRYEEGIALSYQKGVMKAVAYGAFVGGIGFLGGVAILAVVYYGARLVIQDELDAGELTSFILYTLYMTVGLATLSTLYTELMNAVGATKRIFSIIELKPAVDLNAGGRWPTLSHVQGAVSFKRVSFQYPSRADCMVLSDFDLEVLPKQTIALVGTSGAGKSTVLSLLQRFYEIDSSDDQSHGSICIDGVDIRELDPIWLRRVVAAVPQEPVLFSGSIRDNIGYAKLAAMEVDKLRKNAIVDIGSMSPTDDDIMQAAKQANAHDFIMTFPDGYNTLVGERGVRLSGGQKQRVAIARALFADPRILLLDEATSALDSESEALIQQAISQLMANRTVFIVAHRLSTVIAADMIIMLEQGRVVARGRHEELLRSSPKYVQLVHRQLGMESLNPATKAAVVGPEECCSSSGSVSPASGDSSGVFNTRETLEMKDMHETLLERSRPEIRVQYDKTDQEDFWKMETKHEDNNSQSAASSAASLVDRAETAEDDEEDEEQRVGMEVDSDSAPGISSLSVWKDSSEKSD